ncbi:hypothetical protein [Methylobacter luteus]|jgi:hypothetical protein|uniref:hypothetical protein n=1 Tax=Methylobacter luteus TaxID=415 RepID=UPI000407971B|nr:hypothetical protein [Methylobacter luteus]
MPELKKFAVSYTIDYQHRIVVGISALNAESAIKIATKAFDEGEIWEDTPDMPLLFDDYEEIEGETLEFFAEEVSEFPEPDSSVIKLKQDQFAYQACRSLLEGDFNVARDFAQKACPKVAEKPENYCLTSLEVLDLAQDYNLELSLAVNDSFMTGIFLNAQSRGRYFHKGFDGHSKKIKAHEFLLAYPLSLGKVWRIDRKTPAKSLLRRFQAVQQIIVKHLMSLAYFSPLTHLI